MRKKPARAVPEWLNSPLWSAPPPSATSPSPPVPPDPYGADLSPPPPPPPKPPPTVPPPSYEQAVGSSRRARSEAGWEEEEEEDGEVGGGAALRAHLLADFKLALSKKVVNMGELRRLACLGVPDGGAAVRPLVWKVPHPHSLLLCCCTTFCCFSVHFCLGTLPCASMDRRIA